MKFFKYVIILFISVSLVNCSKDSTEPPFVLSNANLAGTYNINSLSVNIKATAITSGIPVTISRATNVGSVFQFDFILNANGSYTASGQYVLDTSVTPTGSSPITNTSIINIDDSGTYQINTTTNTITFTSSKGDFIEGAMNVVVFNETTVSLTQETEEFEDPITTEIDANISFVRK